MTTDIQRINFHGQALESWEDTTTGKVYVAMRPIVTTLGVAWSSQLQRLKRDDLYKDTLGVFTTNTPGGPQEIVGLALDMLPMFLATIQRQRVKPELRDMLLVYQRECAEALRDYWTKGSAINPNAVITATPAQVALAIAKAVVAIEERQGILEASQQSQQAQLDTQAQHLAALTARQPPQGRIDPLSWLRKYSKPYLAPSLLKLFRATCKRLEAPIMWRPDHLDYPLPYQTEEALARAYEESTRQIRFFDGASPTHDPGVPYQRRQRRRR